MNYLIYFSMSTHIYRMCVFPAEKAFSSILLNTLKAYFKIYKNILN